MKFLAFDIGTSAVKAVLVDDRQRVLQAASVPLATVRPHPLWSEQDPDEWWRAVETAVATLRQAAGREWAGISAIGLSGQMHGAVMLDGDGRPVRPAIIWNDGRAHAETKELAALVSDFGYIAGVPPMTGLTAPKLLWMRRHEPEVWARVRRIMLPKDYVRLQMTGTFCTDMCDAAGSIMLDNRHRRWSPEILAACHVTVDMLPRLIEGSENSGTLRREVAAGWGLEPLDVVVAGGTGDAAAGAIGIGAVQDGDAFVSIGTSSQYFVTRTSYDPAPESLIHTFCHGLPGRWFQMAGLLNGASCLAWMASTMGDANIDELLAGAERSFAGPTSLLFLPYLTGERTPLNDPYAKGVLSGLTPAATRDEIIQAVLEGVAFSIGHCQETLAAAGTEVSELAVVGGGSRSLFWMRILANVLDRRLVLYESGEVGPAFGAARLARLARTGEAIADVCRPPPVKQAIDPEPDLAAAYQPRLAAFKQLYQALAPLFRQSAGAAA